MKQHWFSGTVGVVTLIAGVVWIHPGAAHAVTFSPPADSSAPRSATGGASRGAFFSPPADSSAPRSATGGASRSGFFAPPTENSTPRGSTGGASRGSFFVPPVNSSAPQGSTGGASRGDFFTPPTENLAPQGSTGGASRGLFENIDESVATTTSGNPRSNAYGEITAATPASATTSLLAVMPETFYGTTLEAKPTILVYVPASNANTAVFSLKNEAKEMVYQMTIALPETGGIVAVNMPDEAPELAVAENYQWYVAVQLEGDLDPGSPFVDGWIRRIEPSAEMTLALADGDVLSNIETLGANGVWYDTVAQLAELKATQVDEIVAGHWDELLESVGLADISAEPIVM